MAALVTCSPAPSDASSIAVSRVSVLQQPNCSQPHPLFQVGQLVCCGGRAHTSACAPHRLTRSPLHVAASLLCALTSHPQVIAHVRACYPSSTLFAAGWSLGANILVNYLGEQGPDTPLEAAVSMCNPFDLTISNRHINEVSRKAGPSIDTTVRHGA